MSVRYDACGIRRVGGIFGAGLDGEAGVYAADGDASFQFDWESPTSGAGASNLSLQFNGQLNFTGDLNGSCAIDYGVSVSVDSSGEVGEPQYTGTYCGYTMGELLDGANPFEQ